MTRIEPDQVDPKSLFKHKPNKKQWFDLKNKLKPKSKLKTNQACHKHKNQNILNQNKSKSTKKNKKHQEHA